MAVITGTQAADTLHGTAGDDEIDGLDGNDILDGGLGGDRMSGGLGDDRYIVENALDLVVEAAGEGYDTVYTTLDQYFLPQHVEKGVYQGSDKIYMVGNQHANHLEGGAGQDNLDGNGGADIMVGRGGHDFYHVDDSADLIVEAAGEGDDVAIVLVPYYAFADNLERAYTFIYLPRAHLVGNALDNGISTTDGDDTLDGGAGADRLYGGKGDDLYIVDNVGDAAHEEANNGTDTVRVSGIAAYTLAANLEHLIYNGAAGFHAIGNAGDNYLETGAGGDYLDGGTGADTMVGKAGNDIYKVDNADDVIVEHADQGVDTVDTSLTAFTLADHLENLTYWSSGALPAFAATGNALANTIRAGAGDDLIDGGAGADTMIGYMGNDIYIVDHPGDVVQEFGGGGTDEVRTSVGSRSDASKMFVLPANVENLTGTAASAQGVFGNALDNIVKMGAGGDLVVLHDGGNDTVQAGGGNDFLYFGGAYTSADSIDGGAGFDTLGLLGNYALTFGAGALAGIEKLAVYSSGGGAAVPSSYNFALVDSNVAAGAKLLVVAQSLLSHESLTFNGAAETDGSFNVRGGKGADSITGGAGADRIWGNAGADALAGGGGKDMFEYRAAAESNSFGRDTIQDFEAGDRIDLSAIDADGNAGNGNSKFAYIGAAAFGNMAGQLRATSFNGTWLIEGDVNGDGQADLSILLASTAHIVGAADFVL
jgi:Ca2+-binding RTX toxin-like protein